MNFQNIWMKITILIMIALLIGSSYFLYQFLYDQNNQMLRGRFLPVPELDIESYDRLIREKESQTP